MVRTLTLDQNFADLGQEDEPNTHKRNLHLTGFQDDTQVKKARHVEIDQILDLNNQ